MENNITIRSGEPFDIEKEPIDKERIQRELVAARKHPLAHCERCPLRGHGFKMVPSDGLDTAKYAVVGEAPGVQEIIAKERKPFIGASGQVMRGAMRQFGAPDSDVFYTNAVLCRPPDNQLEPYSGAVDACRPRLVAELEGLKDCERVLAAGKYGAETMMIATQGSRARKVGILKQRGEWHEPSGDAMLQKTTVLTVHPAFVLRSPAAFPSFAADVQTYVQGRINHPLAKQPGVWYPKNVLELAQALRGIPDGTVTAFDIETPTLHTWYDRPGRERLEILCVGIAVNTDAAVIINRQMWRNPLTRAIVNQFMGRVKLVAHNGKFDCLWLQRDGVTNAVTWFDTMLAHHTLNESPPHGLKELASIEFGLPDYEREFIDPYKKKVKVGLFTYDMVPPGKLHQYLAWDCATTLALYDVYSERLEREELMEWPFRNLVMRANVMLMHVEQRGIQIDVPYLEVLREELKRDQAKALADIRAITKNPMHNPRSHVQNGKYVYGVLGYKENNSKHYSKRSTGVAAIAAHPGMDSEPFIKALLHCRRIDKVLGTYIEGIYKFLDTEGRVHPTYKQLTETGRLSAINPPIQTLPRSGRDRYGDMIRSAVIARPGAKLIMGDYSQAEMRVWAHRSQEPFLLEVYRNGRDLHNEGADRLFGKGQWNKEKRTWVKNFNFSYIYGGNEYSFAAQVNLPIEAAKAFVRDYDKMMPRAAQWKEEVWREAVRLGYVTTMMGRKRRFPLINADTLEEVKKSSWNAPIQADASDLNLLSAVELDEAGWPVVLSMHDATVLEVVDEMIEAGKAALSETMVGVGNLWVSSVPWVVDVEVQERWAKKVKEDDVITVSEDWDTLLAGLEDEEGNEDV